MVKVEYYLLENFEAKISRYFNSESLNKWKDKYSKSLEKINHDEPWLTLIACYSVFGNQQKINMENVKKILQIDIEAIKCVQVEKNIKEIQTYRDFLKVQYSKQNFHLYPDRKNVITGKIAKPNDSFEGNTNLDLLIRGKTSDNKDTVCFIEAKFLSDISYQITYNPFRDQIARNIDAGIEYCQEKNIEDLSLFYFYLLTPEVFKPNTAKYNQMKELIGAYKSRLYSYKFEEYQNWENLKRALPHREIDDETWKIISENIKWITFEDFYRNMTIQDEAEKDMIKTFFIERNLL
ncbi:MAG: hypothetical protein LBR48_01095 [Dysgonamonadaceae bacterium]|jgi:hypothetical protein|nr:hypothetical protein [Dysgonamonadaceae bacterium]